ncbi:RDD family protein [Streptomyces sp. NBC_00536]|uniref:RDD family protein n=1 Tax=Streptomyces sp. NBC_00536 TaxID=2975769 RepID=UPI002E81B837|nr:RDD family protein [Streptomyces sp. NBC_00536]WUC79291.1 RDD family protein [Streptomyces sp. NBC_00536]
MTASPGVGGHAAREGYYPDPSIPGYVRYWNGASWVPGTSRPAPAEETGPVFLDETSLTAACREPEPRPEPSAVRAPEPEPVVWQADPLHQAGFGGSRDQLVSWGQHEPERGQPEHGHGHAVARPAGVSLGRSRPEPLPEVEAEWHPESRPEPRWEPVREPVREPAAVRGSASGVRIGRTPAQAAAPAPAPAPPAPAPAAPVGILSARSPVAPAAPAPAWPEPEGSRGAPERPAPAAQAPAARVPAPARTAPARPAPAAAVAPVTTAAEAPAQTPAESPAEARSETPSREANRTDHAVFERMAERAVRPAGPVRRLLARAVDSVVLGAVAVAVAQPLVPAVTAHVEAKVEAARGSGRTVTVWLLDGTTTGYLGVVLGAVLLFGVFCEVLPTARWGRTLGKKLLGIRVLAVATRRPPSFGAALRRWLVCALLGLPGSLPCLTGRPRRRTWHDKAAGTYVSR